MSKITFITGGAKSGKSSHALTLALNYPGKRAFVATAQSFDAEMKLRIDNHKKERGNAFFTNPLTLRRDQILKKDMQTFISRLKTFNHVSLKGESHEK